MTMGSTDKELEEQLLDAGNKLLLDPPSSAEELLPLLDVITPFLPFSSSLQVSDFLGLLFSIPLICDLSINQWSGA